MTVPILETERLVLRAWREADRAPFALLNGDPEVMCWVGDGQPLDRVGSDASLDLVEEQWRARGFGLWALEEQGVLVGFCGLSAPWFLPAAGPALEIGWRLVRGAWGRGLASEAAGAVIAHGLGELALTEVIATVHPENTRSVRVAEKLGMIPTGLRVHPSGAQVAVYRTAR